MSWGASEKSCLKKFAAEMTCQLRLLQTRIGFDHHEHAEQSRTHFELAECIGEIREDRALREAQLVTEQRRQHAQIDAMHRALGFRRRGATRGAIRYAHFV